MVCASAAASADELPAPVPHIQTVINEIVAAVALQREQLERDVLAEDFCSAYALVDRYLRPEFSLHTAGSLMLRQHWPAAVAEQDRFVKAFYGSVVATFGDLIRYFNADTLRVTPLDDLPETERLLLSGEMTFNDGKTIGIGLRIRFIDDRWQIFDIQADELSYVVDYRDDYLYEIPEIGFDGLVERLEKEAAAYTDCGQ